MPCGLYIKQVCHLWSDQSWRFVFVPPKSTADALSWSNYLMFFSVLMQDPEL